MKHALIALLILSSTTSYANQYRVDQLNCETYGSYLTISQPKPSVYRDYVKSSLKITSIDQTNEIVRIESDDPSSIVESVKMKDWRNFSYEVNLKAQTAAEVKSLLEKMGERSTLSLPFGLAPTSFTLSIHPQYTDYSDLAHRTDQIHFPADQNDGLSFHITRMCRVSSVYNPRH